VNDLGVLRIGDLTLPCDGRAVHLLGVLNLSTESKNVDTVAATGEEALAIAERHRQAGAAIIDVGAQSSHFENRELAPAEELDRMAPILELLVAEGFVVSVDTWKPEVAAGALEIGAALVNDTGGLKSPEMVEVVARHGAAAVVMYLEGTTPLDGAEVAYGESRLPDMARALRDRLISVQRRGITSVMVDPGIGISYRGSRERYTAHQLEVVRGLAALRALGAPVLVPVPRKSEPPRTLAFATLALEYGADFLRVHDAAAVAEIARLMGRMQ
jgi:dihydropteroate synthase